MKKIICMILAVACLFGCTAALASCGGGSEAKDLFEIASSVSATRTVTRVEYMTKEKLELNGSYQLDVNGEDSIFTYSYKRLRTVEEAIADNSSEKVKVIEGKVYRKDGKTSVDGAEWDAATPTPVELKFNLKADLLLEYEIDQDGTHMLALVDKDKAEDVFGTALNAEENILLEVSTNGTYLTFVTVTYTTTGGASVVIRTSYSYNELTLEFPENIGE